MIVEFVRRHCDNHDINPKGAEEGGNAQWGS